MKIVLFIVLKIVELAVLVFVPYGIGRFSNYLLQEEEGIFKTWVWGLVVIVAALWVVGFGYTMIDVNIQLVDKILG